MLSAILSQVGLLMLLSVWLFAWMKGGPPERWGATLTAATWIGSIAMQALVPADSREMALLVFDFLLAVGLLFIAIAYSSRWLGLAMLLQAVVLALHADAVADLTHRSRHFIMLLNLASLGMLLAIVGSTLARWIARKRSAAASLHTPPASAHPA